MTIVFDLSLGKKESKVKLNDMYACSTVVSDGIFMIGVFYVNTSIELNLSEL